MSDSVRAMNRLAKWRAHFAGWQLGTRSKEDPECQAVRDHREVTLILRAEVTALTGMLIHKGVCTPEELDVAFELEADLLCETLSQRWPGITATDDGLTYDKRAVEWMKGWLP